MKSKNESNLIELKEQKIDGFFKMKATVVENEKSSFEEIGNRAVYFIIDSVSYFGISNDLSSRNMEKFAETGGAFDFLNDPEEDIYTESDGRPL